MPRVLKEGLRHSEVFFDGSDGFSRRRVEKRTLGFLRRAGIPVPAVVDFFTQDEAAYLVLEKIEGATLSELIERGGADLATALQIGLQLADILVAMHAAGSAALRYTDGSAAHCIGSPSASLPIAQSFDRNANRHSKIL